MGLSDQRRDWIISYRRLDHIESPGLDRSVLAGSYCIGWFVSGNNGFYALAGYWMDGMDGTDGIDGKLMGQGCNGPTLAGARVGAPPLAPERERHHWILRGGRLWEVVAGNNCVGAAREQSICVEELK